MGDSWESFRRQVDEAVRDHSKDASLDSFLYNGGTVAVLVATGAATLLPTDGSIQSWVPKLLTGFAAIWVGLERALTFGARWRYHRDMRAGYRSVLQLVDFASATDHELTVDERKALRERILKELSALRDREAAIPGAEAAATFGN